MDLCEHNIVWCMQVLLFYAYQVIKMDSMSPIQIRTLGGELSDMKWMVNTIQYNTIYIY